MSLFSSWSGSNPTSATKRQLRRWYRKEKKKGRPKKYTEAKKIQIKIDEYFESCFKEDLKYNSEKGYYEPKKDYKGNIIKYQDKPFTITGLARALGMTRETLLRYEEDNEFSDTIKKAKQKVEAYVEERLFDRDGVNGAKFNLTNNFSNWSDKQEVDTTSTNRVMIVDDLPSDVDDTT